MDAPVWLLLALFGAAAGAFSSVVDKIEVSRIFRKPWVVFVWWGVYWLSASAILFFFLPQPVSPNVWAVAAGLALVLGSVLYFRAINEEDISRVAPVFNTSPLFALAFSALLLGEALAPKDYAGIIVLASGAMLMGVREPHKLRLGKGARFALANAAISGFMAILMKLAVGAGSQLEVFFWIYFVYGVGNLAYSRGHVKEFARTFSKLDAALLVFLVAMVGEIILANIAMIYAYSMQSAALVAAVGAASPLFVFVYALIASLFIPRILKEEVDARTVLFKVVGAILIVIGVFLVS